MRAAADERRARAAWSALVEPGDAVAAALVATLGPAEAWARVEHALHEHTDVRRGADAVLADGGCAPAAGHQLALDLQGVSCGGDDAGRDERGPGRDRLARALARWAPRAATLEVVQRLDALAELGGTFVVPGDAGWPHAIDALGPAAPFGLWVRGDADLATAGARSVAVVGARAATTYGERVAHDLAAVLADRGVTVVSGGAFGIDAAAHRGALARSGRTVVMLAGGVDRAYPRGNARLLDAVLADGGAIVSEVPVGSVPTRVRFLQRNRLIAGLGSATVVVEAAWRSGAISTAYHAAGLLRPVGVVPGPVTSVASAGCHRLLRSGVAVCVTDAAEVLELAGLDGPAPDPQDLPAAPGDGLPQHVRRVLDATTWRHPLEPIALAASAGVSVADTRGALGLLELDGLVRREGSGWVRART
ncbi:DNA-processing protein DprA [Cellulomonas fimi]|uniref:DNA-processing protein DprA n=1 Tax=Cellulomonas fimi TaxID=1708 RepID=UPI00234CCBAF|nr:DNA-processing protein DprA [Cellulomonas fimi]MDC7121588.1 DNA-processing protein DprA [Cellulomonas fimi]